MMGFAGLFIVSSGGDRAGGILVAAIVMGIVMLPSSEIYGLWACHFCRVFYAIFFVELLSGL